MILDRLGLWPARAVWLVAPATIGPVLGRAIEGRASTPRLLVEIGLWAAWFVVLVALLTPSPRSLTISRIAAPATVGVAVLAASSAGWGGTAGLAIAWAAVVTAIAFLPTVGDRMINGSAYGSERRMALRPPGFALLGPVQLAWLVAAAGLVVPPVLLLREWYVAAVVAAVIGAAAVWAGSRVLHQLARRWIVFVPAGFVIKDSMLLVDAVLFPRSQVSSVGPALVGEGSDHDGPERIDLSGGAMGLAIEVALKQPTPITLRERGEARSLEVTNIVFTPTLPGAMLSEARIRGLKIGTASTPA